MKATDVLERQATRRGFLRGVGGLTFAVGAGGMLRAAAQTSDNDELAPNLWVTIGADDAITIRFGGTELGQGTMTALPLVLGGGTRRGLGPRTRSNRWRPTIPTTAIRARFATSARASSTRPAARRSGAIYEAMRQGRRTGTQGTARCSRGRMGRACLGTRNGTERRRPSCVGKAHELRRNRLVRRGAGAHRAR